MNDESDFQPLEARLRLEARALSSRYGRSGSAEAIVAEHRRRRRRSMGRAAAAACVAAAAIGASWWGIEQRAGRDSPSIVESPRAPVSTPREKQLDKTPDSRIAQQPAGESPNALPKAPLTFLVTEQDGQRVIAVGVYVPPRVEQVKLDDLPPLEQAAVRRLLGLEDEVLKPTI
jgi:hypothetical protein